MAVPQPDLERMYKALESLNKAVLSIQKSRTQEEIFEAAARELKKLKFSALFLLFHEKEVQEVAYATGTLRNLDVSDFTNVRELLRRKESYLDFPLTKSEIPSRKAFLVPLTIHDSVVGALISLPDTDIDSDIQNIPFFHAFANFVSAALEKIQLHQEMQKRADEIARNLEEQKMLRELNTKLFRAQSKDEVLDAAIDGIYALGKSFSNISLLNEEGTHAVLVRIRMVPKLQKTVEALGRTALPGFRILGYNVPVWEEDSIYHQFFKTQIPLVSSSVECRYPVMRAEMSEFYSAFAAKEPFLQNTIRKIAALLPYTSIMTFPIVVGGRTIGTLTITSIQELTEKDFETMRTVGEMVSSAMERVVQNERLTETLNELRALQRVNTLLNTGASLEQILTAICASIREVYHYEFAYPALLDPSRKYFTLTYVHPPPKIAKKMQKFLGMDVRDFRYPLLENSLLFEKVISQKKCLVYGGFDELAKAIPVDEFSSLLRRLSPDLTKALKGGYSTMVAPLPCGEEVIGILLLGHRKLLTERDFSQLEYFLDQVGIAIAKSEVESKLRQSLRELRELDQMKSEFIDIASHELRTPLTTLKLYLEMMALEQYGRLSSPLRERIKIMEEDVGRLEEIINQTLVASRLIKNKLTLEKKPVSLPEVAEEAVNQLRPLWRGKNQNVFIEEPHYLPLVEGDKKALFTVISNLVDNAVRYSPNDTEILITFVEHPEEVECLVVDQGCGIPPEHTEKIFEEFYIVPSGTDYARMDGRTGLGLFIAKGIIERHEGRIWVESVPEKGSTFHFTVPKCEEEF